MADFRCECAFLPLVLSTPQSHGEGMPLLVILLLLVLLAVTAPRWGVDTRDGRDWQPRCTNPAEC